MIKLALVAVGIVTLFFAVTAFTGLPAPGMLERYPYGTLQALQRDIDAQAGELRTPDDCWRTTTGATGPIREVVRVDYVRSRVVVRAYASEAGRIDPVTFGEVTRRIDQVITDHPEFSWGMVQIEASPDGWSPLVSCRLVTRGWVTGF